MIRTFVGLSLFERDWQRLGLTDEDRRALESELLENPTEGAIIAGTSGIRRVRRPIAGKGKREKRWHPGVLLRCRTILLRKRKS